jgi:DNA-binding Xre family transcriptional regulator
MKLKEWLNKKKISITQLAYYTGLTYHQVHFIAKGKTPPLPTAFIIEKFTNKEVTIQDLISPPEMKKYLDRMEVDNIELIKEYSKKK